MKKGVMLAILAAIISGISIFINSYAVKAVPNAYFFATAKNIIVSVLILSVLIGFSKVSELKKLSNKVWGKLFILGLVGGSIPFLLFFKGMSISSSAALNGAFIQKTMFILVAVMAVTFFKEKLTLSQYIGLLLILAGIYLSGGIKSWNFGRGELLILCATVLWAIEALYANRYLKEIDSQIAVFGRMFFGSIIMVGYLLITNGYPVNINLSLTQFGWIMATSMLLFVYASAYYAALKCERATVVTSVLTLAFPITALLANPSSKAISIQNIQIAALILGGVTVTLIAKKLNASKLLENN